MLNRVILMGRITKDLEIRQTTSGKAVLKFTVAVDRGKDKQADFITCVAYGQTAEFISRYFGKGRMIAIEGSIRTGSYEKDGRTIYTFEVFVERVSFTGERNGAQSESRQQGYVDTTIATNASQGAGQTYTGSGYSDFEEVISDSGIPF